MNLLSLGFQEKVIFELRGLYNRYGYAQYKMSKFEEYDLYAKNKDFLISDSVITFMDFSGKLMALKPDVTLSIVKNSKDCPDSVQKLYYNENIYRVAKGSGAFREMMQVGLECLGAIDRYTICEVLTLAVESLKKISPNSVLNVSHLGLLTQILDYMGISDAIRGEILHAIGEKNPHDLLRICQQAGVSQESAETLAALSKLSGSPEQVLQALETLTASLLPKEELTQTQALFSSLAPEILDTIHFDFSVVDDIHYYNGIVFKGFVDGVPNSVLSGGQYDKLMHKMHRKSGAIGFAVYMDALERLDTQAKAYDVDVAVLYDAQSNLNTVAEYTKKLRADGSTVMVQQCLPEGLRYRRMVKICGSEVKEIEANA